MMYLVFLCKVLILLHFIHPVFSRHALDVSAWQPGSFELPLHRRYNAEGNIAEDNYDYLTSVSVGGQQVNILLDTATSLL